MQGTRADPGVLPQALHMIFEEVCASMQPLAVCVSHYEVLRSLRMHEWCLCCLLQPHACHARFLLVLPCVFWHMKRHRPAPEAG